MRPPKALSVLALTVLLFQTTGCRSWAPLHRELPTRLLPSGSGRAVKIRVETTEGARHELERGWMSSDSVGGVSALGSVEAYRSFPLTQVRTVEESELNGAGTFFLGVGEAAVILVGVAIAICYTGGIYGGGCD